MARAWKARFKNEEGTVYTFYVHDDGKWEADPQFPPIDYVEYSEMIKRINLACAQFNQMNWAEARIEKVSAE